MEMGLLRLYLNETLASFTASLRPYLLAFFIDTRVLGLFRVCFEVLLETSRRISNGFSGLSEGVEFRVGIDSIDCYSAICQMDSVTVSLGLSV